MELPWLDLLQTFPPQRLHLPPPIFPASSLIIRGYYLFTYQVLLVTFGMLSLKHMTNCGCQYERNWSIRASEHR
jgi:hypothetical protein